MANGIPQTFPNPLTAGPVTSMTSNEAVGASRCRRRPLGFGAILALVVCGVVACSGGDPGPARLIGDSVSRIDPEAAKRQFGRDGAWRVIDDWRGDPRAGRPSAHILRVWVEPYSDLGRSGALMLVFFNDHLESSTFFPTDMTQYLSDLRVQRGLKLSRGVAQRIAPGTRVYAGKNATGQAYVTWEDGALADQRRRATD